MTHAIRMSSVRKTFGKKVAVEGIDLELPEGSLYGLIGPNGAGKTTTIRMVMSIIFPDSGELEVLGRKSAVESKDRIGYLPEERGVYRKMKVKTFLEHMGKLKGMDGGPPLKREIAAWLEKVGLEDVADKKCEELSKGMQQKIQFIATILHDPDLLILDEPFGGLDPINSELLQNVILEFKEMGKTIVFASHRMEQVEQLCDDICLVSKGEIVLSGTLNEIKRRYERDTILLDFEGSDRFLDDLERGGRIRISTRSTRHAEIKLNPGFRSREVLEAAMRDTEEITRFDLVEPPMREIFVKAVTEQQGADAAKHINVATSPVART